MQRIFGRAKTPEEQLKEWRSEVRGQSREIDKQIRNIESQEAKVKADIKMAARRPGSEKAIRTLATELVRSKKAKEQLLTGKTQLNSVTMQLQEQMSMVKVSGCIQKSAEIMATMNGLLKLPQISQNLQVLSQEMLKAGLIEEMMQDTMDQDIEEDVVNEEVDKIIDQVTTGVLTQAKSAPVTLPKSDMSVAAGSAVNNDGDEADLQLSAMRAKLQALK